MATYAERKADRIRATIDAAVEWVRGSWQAEGESLFDVAGRMTCKVHPSANPHYLDGYSEEERRVIIDAFHVGRVQESDELSRLELEVSVYELLAARARKRVANLQKEGAR